jgi:WD40 repeat protein
MLVTVHSKGQVTCGKVEMKFPATASALAVSSDGKKIAVAGEGGKIKVWDRSGTELTELSVGSPEGETVSFDLETKATRSAPDTGAVATGAQGSEVLLVDSRGASVRHAKELREIRHHPFQVGTSFPRASVSPDGRSIAISGGITGEGNVLFHLEDSRGIALGESFLHAVDFAWSADGSMLAVGGVGGHHGEVGGLEVFAPDGRLLHEVRTSRPSRSIPAARRSCGARTQAVCGVPGPRRSCTGSTRRPGKRRARARTSRGGAS